MLDETDVQHKVSTIGMGILDELKHKHGRPVAECWALVSLLILETAHKNGLKTIDVYKAVGEACIEMSENCRLAGADSDIDLKEEV